MFKKPKFKTLIFILVPVLILAAIVHAYFNFPSSYDACARMKGSNNPNSPYMNQRCSVSYESNSPLYYLCTSSGGDVVEHEFCVISDSDCIRRNSKGISLCTMRFVNNSYSIPNSFDECENVGYSFKGHNGLSNCVVIVNDQLYASLSDRGCTEEGGNKDTFGCRFIFYNKAEAEQSIKPGSPNQEYWQSICAREALSDNPGFNGASSIKEDCTFLSDAGYINVEK